MIYVITPSKDLSSFSVFNVAGLLLGWFCSEKIDLEVVAFMKIKQLTLDLEADSAKEVFPIEKIKERTHTL
nr:carbonic anhydrase 2 [Tanacetum cinerariifolium]